MPRGRREEGGGKREEGGGETGSDIEEEGAEELCLGRRQREALPAPLCAPRSHVLQREQRHLQQRCPVRRLRSRQHRHHHRHTNCAPAFARADRAPKGRRAAGWVLEDDAGRGKEKEKEKGGR
eukprot:328797-Rhodomonas_salina.1